MTGELKLEGVLNPRLKCEICNKTFAVMKSLYRHKRKIHKLNPDINTRLKNYKCTLCPYAGFTVFEFRQHLESTHQQESRCSKHTFSSKDDFHFWKKAVEKSTCSSFIQQRGAKLLKDGSTMIHFVCHRSGKFVSKGKGKRLQKSQGSCKLGIRCTSEMVCRTLPTSETTEVDFYEVHHGHDKDLEHIHISAEEKAAISDKLLEGFSMDEILDNIRKNKTRETVERINLLTRKDLHNISSSLIKDDATSLDVWVTKMKKMDDQWPVLFYKKQGEESKVLSETDFMLVLLTREQSNNFPSLAAQMVCVDSTDGTDDFRLTTLVSVDEFGEAYPGAFCISNRTDAVAMSVFYKAVRERVGLLSCRTFMSSGDTAYYSAWVEAMCPSQDRLLCAWYIDRNWRKRLASVKNHKTAAEVYKSLRMLLEETSVNKFKNGLKHLQKRLKDDSNTIEFHNYLVENYLCKCEQWAYCFRNATCVNAHTHLEALHRLLQHFQGKVVNRIDKCLTFLTKLMQDTENESAIRAIEDKTTSTVSRPRKLHSLTLLVGTTYIVRQSHSTWIVSSRSTSEQFSVEKKEHCTVPTCKLICEPCGICVHEYSCTCVDNTVYYTICKHIHAVVIGLNKDRLGCPRYKSRKKLCTRSEPENVPIEDVEVLIEEVPLESSGAVSSEMIASKMNHILELVHEYQPKHEVASKLNEKLDEMLLLLQGQCQGQQSSNYGLEIEYNSCQRSCVH